MKRLLAVGVSALVSWGAHADTVVLTPVKDNTLISNETNSNGAGDSVFSGRTGSFGNQTVLRAVMAFDVTGSIPTGSTIDSATLTLELVQASILGGPETHTLHRISRDWGEGTSSAPGGQGAPATSGDATWLHTFFPSQFWTNAGGDYEAIASASQTVSLTLGPYTWGSTAQMVADVAGWLDSPATSLGWMLRGNEVDSNTAKRFASREAAIAEIRPTLTVEFTPPPPLCPWDCDGTDDGVINVLDLLVLLGHWGESGACDFDGNVADVGDLLKLLGRWGDCPDPNGCGSPDAGSCFVANGTPACNNQDCCNQVCAVEPACCDSGWDLACKALANSMCGTCGDAGAGDCCQANGTPGCDDAACCRLVCEIDGFCCGFEWDTNCALEAAQSCACE